MSRLLVAGAGGHGRVVADSALESRAWTSVAFVDDRIARDAEIMGCRLVGGFKDLERLQGEYGAIAIGVGDAQKRLEVLGRCRSLGFDLPVIAHPAAVVSRHAVIGAGSVLIANAVVNTGAVLGRACIINTGATVDHDCRVEDGVHICPGAHLAGDVHVGRMSWIGIGASIREGVTIGARVTVGAGAVVVSNIADGLTVIGVPAREGRRQ